MAEWQPIPSLNGSYEASSDGFIRHVGSDRILKARRRPGSDVQRINVWKDGRHTQVAVHRLVLEAFGALDGRRLCEWKDGDQTNNSLDNLIFGRKRCTTCDMPLTDANGYQDRRTGRFRPRCRVCAIRRKREIGRNMADLNARCDICGSTETATRGGQQRRPTRDHDHVTGQQRGVLCNRCNAGLGMFKDSASLLRLAALYLEEHGTTETCPSDADSVNSTLTGT